MENKQNQDNNILLDVKKNNTLVTYRLVFFLNLFTYVFKRLHTIKY